MDEFIQLSHGNGGKESARLIKELVLKHFKSSTLAKLDDAAELTMGSGRLAFTTDSYVIDPIFFPGGNIGDLAICGTVNDLAVQGAIPRYISVGLIIEEGLPVADLNAVLAAMARRSVEAGVEVVTGDTKVVGRGGADKLYINTSGIGEIPSGRDVGLHRISSGDMIVINGSIAEHGAAIMLERKGISIDAPIQSDVAPLSAAIASVLDAGIDIKFMRDLTRGGLASTLNDVATSCTMQVEIEEDSLPVKAAVKAVAEMLGLEPCQIANEGKFILVCSEKETATAVEILRRHPGMEAACVIGKVSGGGKPRVLLRSGYGSTRILDNLTGEVLPRIC